MFMPRSVASRLRTEASIRLSLTSARRCFSGTPCCGAAYGSIGLGAMGYPMAQNLRKKIDKNDELIIHDVNAKAATQFKEEMGNAENIHIAGDVRQVAEQASTILTVLPEPHHVRTVYNAIMSPGALPSLSTSSPRLFIDCSTIDPITSRAVARDLTSTLPSTVFVDAPMSGGVVGARAGKLTFMLGAPQEHVERVKSVLNLMGARIAHLGDQGAGLAGKLANNYALAVNNIAAAEAMSMAIQWGLDPEVFAAMMNTATGRSWPSEVNNPVPGVVKGAPAERGYEGGFGISLMRKDLGLAIESAKEFGVKTSLAERAMEVYQEAQEDVRCKGKDFSSVYRWLEGPEDGKKR